MQCLQNQLASIRASCGSDPSVHDNQFYAHNTNVKSTFQSL